MSVKTSVIPCARRFVSGAVLAEGILAAGLALAGLSALVRRTIGSPPWIRQAVLGLGTILLAGLLLTTAGLLLAERDPER